MNWSHIAAFTLVILPLGCGAQQGDSVTSTVKSAAQNPVLFSEDKASAAPRSDVKNFVSNDSPNSVSDDELIQGRWEFVTLVNGTKDFIDFSQNEVTFCVGEKTAMGTFVIDDSTQPKQIDITFAGNAEGLTSLQGIYGFRQDLLAMCLATTDGDRPTEFKGTERQNLVLFHRPSPETIRGPK